MNLNIENNKIQLEDSDTKNEKGDSEKNIYAIEPNNEEKKEEKNEKIRKKKKINKKKKIKKKIK